MYFIGRFVPSPLVTLGALAGYSVSAIASEGAYGLLSSGATWFLAGLVVQLGSARRVAWQKVLTQWHNGVRGFGGRVQRGGLREDCCYG